MTVHVLLPVFNRLAMTRRVLDCLRVQRADEPIHLVLIDDGSTDGTAEFLAGQSDVVVLKGDGSLWWGGAIERGLQSVLRQCSAGDWVLLINNDVSFNANFIQVLLDVARSNAPAVVGGTIRDQADPARLLSIGAKVDTWRLRIEDKLDLLPPGVKRTKLYQVDALSGRGVLYPVAAFRDAGTMRPRWLPHYLADYELAVRVRKAGYRLLVSEDAFVTSADEFGNAHKAATLWGHLFAVRSAYYLPAVFSFWWSASSCFERLSLLPRIAFVVLRRGLRS